MDCLHLLTAHQPGNEIHILPEVSVPGGNVDYFLTSAKDRKVRDFVGIELQTLDTTGTVWPERQRFLRDRGIEVPREDVESRKTFGMNWKMTAKTILIQLHHKVQTFEHLHKHLVLASQNKLIDYMRREFSFGHLKQADVAEPMHFHGYEFGAGETEHRIHLVERLSTDTDGIARCLGLQVSASVEMATIIRQLETKMSDRTLLSL
jgi:hypothetical protein